MICIFKHSQIWDLRGIFPTDVFNSIQAFHVSAVRQEPKIVGANFHSVSHVLCKEGPDRIWTIAPCEDSLMQHTLRANYQAAIGRRSLENLPESQHHQQDMAGNSMMAVRSKSDGWRVYQLQMSS
ncbi:hypothetical protein GWK47_024824 [Chionoecetes opilio]|uniref:Uncharacterized protein n=1 Tax=Chionoecetes opilio TaxID=41210 RepID=A0A8J4XPJ1_CHIOP|nr:hypothetical protein GWK47_024824 [Chionoecetes opilio]